MDKEAIIKAAGVEAAKATPPIAVLADAASKGWTMTHTATAITIAYILLQAAYLLWKWKAEREDRRARLDREAMK